MNVLIAFDSFKDCLTAQEACQVASEAILSEHPDWKVVQAPFTDGGEGFTEILTRSAGGTLQKAVVSGPLGDPVEAVWGIAPVGNLEEEVKSLLKLEDSGVVAVVEMAQASGLQSLTQKERNPWKTSTYGTGELLAHAVGVGAQAIVLGVGGSATNDIGLGALDALGLEGGGGSPEWWTPNMIIGGRIAYELPPIKIACDVHNPLIGPQGATAVFGPQKGLKPEDREELEARVDAAARKLCAYFGKPESLLIEPGGGAAGGLAFGLRVGCDAELISGFSLVSAWLNLPQKVEEADWVITGEGRFDRTSLQGKGPGTLLAMAREMNKPAIVMAGLVEEDVRAQCENAQFYQITPEGYPKEQALREAPGFLREKVAEALRER